MHRLSIALAVLSALPLLGIAHPPEEGHAPGDQPHRAAGPARLWSNARTREAVRGSFLAASGGRVSIERENGDVVVFAIEDLSAADRAETERFIEQVKMINAPAGGVAGKGDRPAQSVPFEAFAPLVRTRWDDRWLHVESDGLPHDPVAHPLMVGIRSWQQQVPLPQAYTGDNAWRIPLKPEMAKKPVSARTGLFRGAIALAANGVPIFNALNNRGDDAFKAGELDQFGGHSGRADDYHYHIAPLALQRAVGPGQPIAYALDGYALYGLFDPAAKPGTEKACPLGGVEPLDELNGHRGRSATGQPGEYHYHASVEYPYINGGMRGKVNIADGQVDPQPRANPVRPWLQPLRGASITGFKTTGPRSWSLEYTLDGQVRRVDYRVGDDGRCTFDFVDPDGARKTETYTPGRGGDRPPRGDPPPRDDRRAPRGRGGPPPNGPSSGPGPAAPEGQHSQTGFTVTSPAVGADGLLPAEFTCDGAGISPPVHWSGAPEGTRSFAVTMHHIPPSRDGAAEEKHVYLVVHGLGPESTGLSKGDEKSGVRGLNTVNRRAQYAPPCSKGPGLKTYTITVYALSEAPRVRAASAAGPTMDELLAAIKGSVLASAAMDVRYERPAGHRE